MNLEIMQARRAIESLRSGVPNRDVALQLGTTQHEIRERFEDSMDAIAQNQGVEPIHISATFGAGKTHLLSYLQSLAEREGFVTSYVVISPEMPLGNAHFVLKALAEAARAPERAGRALRALAPELTARPAALGEVSEWGETSGIDDRFRALIRLYDAYRVDEEFRLRVLADFEGTAILKTVLKGRLKQINELSAFNLGSPRNALLAHDRIRLLAQLYKAAGCKGWVIFFDEMERVAKFSLNQRLAAYSQLGWWRRIAQTAGSAILPIFTSASGFVADTVTGGVFDEQRISSIAPNDERDRDALAGIDLLKSPARLGAPTVDQEEEIKYRVRSIYERAYGASVLESPSESPDIRISIRSEIRRWITLWDLQRYYPEYRAEVTVGEVHFDPDAIGDAQIVSEDNETVE
jgi:hypothetical protein